MGAVENVMCPFCGEDGFDGYGLKVHLLRGWCEVFEEIEPDSAPLEELRRPTPSPAQGSGT